MKKYIAMITAVVILLSTLVLGALPAAADDTITVSSIVPLMVNGATIAQFPVTVNSGDVVSVVYAEYYLSAGERYTFLGWSDGTKATSFKATGTGTITANWAHEILIQVTSVVSSLQQSLWLPYGIAFKLKAEAEYSSGNTRYDFLQWSGGETPYLAENNIVPLTPMSIEAQFVKKDLLTILAPEGITVSGSGWYTDGASLVLQAPQDIYDTAKTSRQDFKTWESVGSTAMVLSNPTSAVMTLTVSGPYTLQADYQQQYLVTAVSPFGSLNHDWVTEGEQEQLSAPDTQVVVTDQEQYVFTQWTGIQGLVSPKVSGTVAQPLALTAVYEHQYKVTLVSANGGSGDGWIKAGAMTTITVPAITQKGLFMRSKFTGFAGYSGKATSLQVLVQGPMTITALYSTGLDLRVVGVIIAALLAAIILWALGKRIKLPSWFN
jgi:hypothetical protein